MDFLSVFAFCRGTISIGYGHPPSLGFIRLEGTVSSKLPRRPHSYLHCQGAVRFKKFVPLGRTFAASNRSDFDLPGVRGYGQVTDESVFRFAGGAYSIRLQPTSRVAWMASSVRDRAYLIEFN